MDPDLLNIIEDGCRHVMLLLGYKPLNGSETMQYINYLFRFMMINGLHHGLLLLREN